MVGGVKWEHGHRMIAEFIGLLIIVMAVWTQRVEQPQVDAGAGLDRPGSRHWPGYPGRAYRADFPSVVDLDRPRHAWRRLSSASSSAWRLFTSRSWLQDCRPVLNRCAPEHYRADHAGRSLRLGAVDPGRRLPPLGNQAVAAPHRRVCGHRDVVLDRRPRAHALRKASITCASRRSSCWRC